MCLCVRSEYSGSIAVRAPADDQQGHLESSSAVIHHRLAGAGRMFPASSQRAVWEAPGSEDER